MKKMANELRSHLIPAPKRTLFIWALLAAMLLTAVLYASGMTSVTKAQTTYQTDPSIPPPKSATAAQVGADIVVSWGKPGGQVDGYQILRSKDSSNFRTIVENTGNTDTTYTDTPATSGRYKYRIKTIRGNNISPNSPKATVNFIATAAAAAVPTPEVETVVEEVTEVAVEVTAETEVARLTGAIQDQPQRVRDVRHRQPAGREPDLRRQNRRRSLPASSSPGDARLCRRSTSSLSLTIKELLCTAKTESPLGSVYNAGIRIRTS